MITPKLHEKENKRLEALRNSGLLDGQHDEEYEEITDLISYITNSPVAMISLIDSDKQIFKSKIGLAENETPRDESFCGHAILENDLFIIEDAEKDERFHDNPFVTKKKLKFYAGTQLRNDEGLPLGMLCVMDKEPRMLNEKEKKALKTLGKQVIAQMKLKEKQKEVTRELEIARNIQYSMLPKTFIPRRSNSKIQLTASMNCAKEVGGNLYDYFYINDENLVISIGDVSRRGVSAAMYMAMTKVLLQAMTRSSSSISECIENVNNLLLKLNETETYTTLFYGVLNVITGVMEYVNVGHNQPVFAKRNCQPDLYETNLQPELGVREGQTYTSDKIFMDDGDTLILYTNGIVEAFDQNQNEYTEQRLINLLSNNCNKPLEDINDEIIFDVFNHSQGVPQSDDMTMLLLRFAK